MGNRFSSKRGRLSLEALEDRLALTATTYVASLYENVLGRTGSSSEVQSWVASMEDGATAADVADGFIASDEYRTIEIRGYYEAYLGRTPGSSEVQGWLEAARDLDEDGGDNPEVLEQVEEQIAASSESFQRGGGTQSGWLANVYQGALGRQMADGEDDSWLELLEEEDNYLDVAEGIIESSEADARVVRESYVLYLSRSASDAEVQSWVGAFHDDDHEDFDRAAFYRDVLASTEYQDANGL